jgi:hypothetical protein
MNFSLKKAFNNVVAPVAKVYADVINPVKGIEKVGEKVGVDTTGILDGVTGGAASKYTNVGNTFSDLVGGESVRDNIADGMSLYQQAQGAQNTFLTGSGGLDYKALLGQLQNMNNRKANTSDVEDVGGNYYSVPNIVPDSGMNQLYIYGGLAFAATILILKLRK